MPLLFSQYCDLVSALEDLSKRDPPLLPARLQQKIKDTIKSWFISHRVSIHSQDIDVVALLSALFPTKRTDRVYCFQPAKLSRSLRRWLCLGSSRWPRLDQWQRPGLGDFGTCVERILKQAEFPVPHNRDRVTLEEVDNALAAVAAQCRFSAPKVRARGLEEDPEVNKAFESIYRRLQSRDAKWFTRLILKDFSCLDLPESLIYHCIDHRLRLAMQMYHNFDSAISELRSLPASQMVSTAAEGLTQQCADDARLLLPKVGVKVGPPKWIKAKGGIKHAVSIVDRRVMSVERKHDGEYCQIHVDLSRGEDCIQIFSKSGKDSTMDRMGVHGAIKDGLRIGKSNCRFSEKCILEGELVVYCDRTKDVLGFHKIRKHVNRSGIFLGTALDSQPHEWEHLMIMYYDVMLIDNDPVIHQPCYIRRHKLEDLIERIEGRSDLVFQKLMDFARLEGPNGLKEGFAFALVRRWEGLVLKPADEAYFGSTRSVRGGLPYWIKLKKDCIKGLGDTADFAVVGAGYDVQKATRSSMANPRWTHFYIGCLLNKHEVLRANAKPRFLVFNEVSDCIKREDLKSLNERGYIRAMESTSDEAREIYDIEYAFGVSGMKHTFRVPFIFDIAGSGFDKAPNREFFTLRFPRVMKVHWDRDWRECVGLDELQKLAKEALRVPPRNTEMAEKRVWEEQLTKIDNTVNGRLTSWDVSDDEEDSAEPMYSETPTSRVPATSRRSRTPAAPPMIRMDTGEMEFEERRLSSGEVVRQSDPTHLLSNSRGTSSLRTPPGSSPKSSDGSMRSPGTEKQRPSKPSHGCIRKRSATEAYLDERPASNKKLQSRSERGNLASSSVNHRQDSSARKLQTPLREIMNPAEVTKPREIDESPQRDAKSKSGPSDFVRKLPAGAESPQRSGNHRVPEEPSSPARETTTSERTSTAENLFEEAVSQHSQVPIAPTNDESSIPTPPGTADPPSNIKFPDLSNTKIILGPSLISNHRPKGPLKDLLPKLGISPSSYRQAYDMPRSNNILFNTFTTAETTTARIVLLEESESSETMVTSMLNILRIVEFWHPRPVTVWDWRILSLLAESEGSGVDSSDTSAHESHLFATMTWDESFAGVGAVKVRWRDGLVVMVMREAFEHVYE